jgi:hypothetical protein
MRRWLYLPVISLALILVFLLPLLARNASETKLSGSDAPRPTRTEKARAPLSAPQEKMTITAVPWGPTQADVGAATRIVMRAPAVLQYLRGTSYRKLSFEFISPDNKGSSRSTPPRRFRLTIYDYTHNRTIIAEGSFDRPGVLSVRLSNGQPPASEEEFAFAEKILLRDSKLGPALRDKLLKTYHPMPPVLYPQTETSRIERTIMVGLMPSSAGNFRNEVVGVNMTRQKLIRYESGAPPTSLAAAAACGITASGQSTTTNGTAGQFLVTSALAGTELWNFIVVRPSASSGNSGERSGIELQNVKYRGKLVLKRAHVPVLNVKYDGDACGPYRDWQYSEGFFQTIAAGCTSVAGTTTSGVSVCKDPATTALESGNDTGNFRGVAIYPQGTELVLVTELNAGWYRYIHEWRLDADGTIRPRYGFGATSSSCVCAVHHHHVYWRFDFDIGTASSNSVFGVVEGAWWQPPAIATEGQFYRNQDIQSWMVKNLTTGDAYKIRPGNDGTAFNDPLQYGKGDLWVLLYHSSGGIPTELDDPNTTTAANIDAWVNNESVVNQDVVIWYGAHFDHDDGGNRLPSVIDTHEVDILSGDHVVGPDLIPVSW